MGAGSACSPPGSVRAVSAGALKGTEESWAEPAVRIQEEPALGRQGSGKVERTQWLPLELSPCYIKNLTGELCGPLIKEANQPLPDMCFIFLSLPQAHC